MLVLLENIRSKFNVGAIFRTAEAFAFKEVILTGFTPQLPDKEISKTALGAEEYLKWRYWQNPIDAIKELKSQGVIIIAGEVDERAVKIQACSMDPRLRGDGKEKNANAKENDISDKYCIVLGNEIHGVSKEALDLADIIVEIPMLGKVKESLNVEVAFGILAAFLRFK